MSRQQLKESIERALQNVMLVPAACSTLSERLHLQMETNVCRSLSWKPTVCEFHGNQDLLEQRLSVPCQGEPAVVGFPGSFRILILVCSFAGKSTLTS